MSVTPTVPLLRHPKAWTWNVIHARGNEYEQAILRVLIALFFLLYFLFDWWISRKVESVIWFMLSYFCASVITVYWLRRAPAFSSVRATAIMIADVAGTTCVMYLAGATGAIGFVVYLWLIIGNGFRYGLRFLFICMALSVIGFGSLPLFSNYWSAHGSLSASLLLGLIILPLYASVLIRRLNDALRRAEVASQAKGQFLARMSHELRTPLHAVVSSTDLLANARYTAQEKTIFRVLRDSVDALLGQVDQILDLAKIEAGRMEVIVSSFNLRRVLSANLRIFEPAASKKGLRFRWDVPADVPAILIGDPRNLGEVLQNIVGNAIKFTSTGTVVVTVRRMEAQAGEARLRFDVLDTGIGIAPEFLPQVFDRFAQQDGSMTRRFEGTGLGTAIAKQLVELMGGTIEVSSRCGEGTNFWFELPFVLPEASTNDATALDEQVFDPSSSVPGKSYARQTRHVLVADDNPVNRMLIQHILEDTGYQVTVCENGEQAKQEIQKNIFDLAILDIHMPGKGGFEVVQELRNERIGGLIPVMVLTADVTTETRQRCEQLSLAFLAKPVRRETLLSNIEVMLAGQVNETDAPATTADAPCNGKQPGNCELLDWGQLNDTLDPSRDPAWAKQMVKKFMIEAKERLQDIGHALAGSDARTAQRLLHSAKGMAAMFGASGWARILQAYEQRDGMLLTAEREQILRQLDSTLTKTETALITYLQNRQGEVMTRNLGASP